MAGTLVDEPQAGSNTFRSNDTGPWDLSVNKLWW